MIKIKDLTVKYQTEVLKNVSYNFEKSIYIIFGPNGSGKSTLFKCILNMIKYDGNIKVDNQMFYIPEKIILPKSLKIKDYLLTIRDITKSSVDINYYLNRYNLNDTTLGKCSKGMLQKVGIISSFISNYKILLYDEPFEGLDKESQKIFIEDIKLKSKDSLIIMSLHDELEIDGKKLKIENQGLWEV